MFVGIGLLVLAGLCWVVIGIAVSRCSAEKLSYNIVQMIASSGTALVCIPILLLPDQWPQLPWRILLGVFLLHFAAGMANYFNYVLLEKAMRMGHNGIVWGIMQSGLLAPFLMGVFFFHVPVPLWRVGGILAILGAAPLLQPLQGDRISPVDLGVMLFCAVILYPMMRTGNTISRKEGAFLLFVYVAYTTWLIVA